MDHDAVAVPDRASHDRADMVSRGPKQGSDQIVPNRKVALVRSAQPSIQRTAPTSAPKAMSQVELRFQRWIAANVAMASAAVQRSTTAERNNVMETAVIRPTAATLSPSSNWPSVGRVRTVATSECVSATKTNAGRKIAMVARSAHGRPPTTYP